MPGLKYSIFIFLALAFYQPLKSQQITKDQLLFLTREWKGDRFADGRPKVPDSILNRMKLVTLEEAWAVLRNENYNTWPIELLVKRDVYVVDQFGAHEDGPTIGDNLGNAIFSKTGNGIIYDGAIRDINGLKELRGFTSFFRTYHPSHHLNNPAGDLNTTLTGINQPTRIGKATAMPGDVVLGRDGGVIFIPPHLAEKVVKISELVRLRDMFSHQRLREGKYTSGQIDTRWSDDIERDFSKWLNDHINELPVPKSQIQELLKARTW